MNDLAFQLHDRLQVNDGLIDFIRSGDKEAFNELYQRYFSTVYQRVRYTIPEADIEDVTQDIFIAVMRSVANFQGRSKFSTWLRTLVNRQVADYYRKRSRGPVWLPLNNAEMRASASHTGGPQHDERIMVRRALQGLPEHYQEVLLLRFAEGLRFQEIAGVLAQNPEAVKSLFRRAVAALRNNLETTHDS